MRPLSRTISLLLATTLVGCVTLSPDSSPLRLVGSSDLGGRGLHGDVAVVGRIALVASGIHPAAGIHTHFYNPYPCGASDVKIVDLANPAKPRVIVTIPVATGAAPIDVDAMRVRTPAFTGTLAAIALARCSLEGDFIDRGVVYYDLSDPSAPRFLGRYHADADMVKPDAPPCGPKPEGSGERCASSQHSVVLAQHPSGRLLSLSTEPGASASGYPSGDLRIVDVTNPEKPAQIASFPRESKSVRSPNGCRPFSAGHSVGVSADGTTAFVAWFDEGVIAVDLSDPASPRQRSQFGYARNRSMEGNAGYVTATQLGGRRLAIVSEEDWIAPSTTLRISSPSVVAGERIACEAMFTLYDGDNDAQLWKRPGRRIEGEIVYAGRGCPANPGSGGHAGSPATDPYLADATGKIVLLDRTRQETQPALSRGGGCSVVERAKRAQDSGAIAVIVAQTVESSPEAFSPDGLAHELRIPVVQMDKSDTDLLRKTLCPAVAQSNCSGGATLRGTLTDEAGEWGAIRIIDMTDDAKPRQVGWYQTPRSRMFPPPDLGVYSVHHAVVDGSVVFVAANSDGLRVIDLDRGARETGHFVPTDRVDPTGLLPAKSYVTGVAVVPGTRLVVITDVHSGLYVLERP